MIRALILCIFCYTAPVQADPAHAAGQIRSTTSTGSCSGVLVAADLVLTAAHCINPGDDHFIFRPGAGPPGADPYRLRRIVHHPLYAATKSRTLWRLRFDFALARLDRPVPAAQAMPATAGEEAATGETLHLLSWRNDGTKRPRQRLCRVIDGAKGLVTLGCLVRGGESGAPLMRRTEDGLELVAIISSVTKQRNQRVAQASNVALRLQPLLDLMAEPQE